MKRKASWGAIMIVGIFSTFLGSAAKGEAEGEERAARGVPVILDTDIGDDIDDSWALAMLLKCPEFDVKLITTTNGKAEYRAKLIAKMLAAAGRTDIPIGLGAGDLGGGGAVDDWVRDYRLSDYPGTIRQNGVQALVDTVNALADKKQKPIVLAIGPLHTLEAALKLDPDIAAKADFVGMHGSVRKGYNNDPQPCVEFNMTYVPGAKKVFAAPWRSAAITPLDTCGLVKLDGAPFAKLKASDDPTVKALLESYRVWAKKKSIDDLNESSVLFDTAAVYLAGREKPLLELESLSIGVTDQGMTVVLDPEGGSMRVATNWQDLAAYREHLVKVLLSPTVKAVP
jgi:inosine-uridine nucleoside N-ribohydrolase